MTNEQWQDWTPCQMYGHLFEDGTCRDCGEPQDPDDAPAPPAPSQTAGAAG